MLVFPYEMSSVHKQILQSYANKFILPDIPSMDKAEHNLLLRSHEFQDIPFLLAVSSDGTIINDYTTRIAKLLMIFHLLTWKKHLVTPKHSLVV